MTDSKKEVLRVPLGRTSKTDDHIDVDHTDIYQGSFLEITLNPPRTKGFINATSKVQKSTLLAVFRNATKRFNCTSAFTYEYSNDGNIHLHGFMKLKDSGVICGLIQDVAKCFLRCFKQCNKPTYYHAIWKRFRAPCCVVQWRDKQEDINNWIDYMNKQQYDTIETFTLEPLVEAEASPTRVGSLRSPNSNELNRIINRFDKEAMGYNPM